jgi:hydrogenase/urease accessory protein HupE
MLFVALFLGFSRSSLGAGIIVYAVAYAASQTLVTQNWLTLFPALPPIIATLTLVLPSLDLAQGQHQVRGWIAPFWLSMLFLGLLYGGTSLEALFQDGLSRDEQQFALTVFTLGIGSGLALIVLCMSELRWFIASLSNVAEDQATRRAGYFGGIAAWGLCLYYGSTFLVYTPEVFTFAVIPLLLALLLGVQFSPIMRGNPRWMLPLFGGLFSVGLLAGFRGMPVPLTTVIVLGSLVFFGFLSLVQRTIPSSVLVPLAILALVYHGWYLGNGIGENMALPIPNTVGAALLVNFVLYIGISLFEGTRSKAASRGIRVLGGGIVVLALALRLREYHAWIGEQLIPEMALGMLPLPLLALVLIVVLIFNWPQKPKFRANVDQPESSPVFHWVFLGITFFLLPYGIMRVQNPFFEPHPPSTDSAKKIVTVLLTNTYKAFNLDEENVVYDQLAETVTEDLIADIYLDSRRRLEAGTLEGAKVTVKDVRVLAMREAGERTMPEEGFLYECQWSVTANVRHWKHTHNRQNLYTAILTLKVIEDHWKISHIELLSEERVIMRT